LRYCPFTAQREPLFDQLGRANLALMLSWHEGFGLTGWEAIAAQVPLIVSRQSGLYRLVQESVGDPGTACLKVLDIQGQEGDDDSTNFTVEDEAHVRDVILEMVRDMGRWQQNAASLKGFLADKLVCTWEHTAKQFCEALGVDANTSPAARAEGRSEPTPASTHRPEIIPVKTETAVPDRIEGPVRIPISNESKRRRDDDDIILKAATDLVESLKALDQAVHKHLTDLVLFDAKNWSDEQRNEAVKDINAFARREEIIPRIRHSLGALEVSAEKADDADKELIQTIINLGEKLRTSLGGPDATFFPHLNELEVYLHNIKTAQSAQEVQTVIDKTNATLRVLNRDTLAVLERTLGKLTSQIGHRHGAPPDE